MRATAHCVAHTHCQQPTHHECCCAGACNDRHVIFSGWVVECSHIALCPLQQWWVSVGVDHTSLLCKVNLVEEEVEEQVEEGWQKAAWIE